MKRRMGSRRVLTRWIPGLLLLVAAGAGRALEYPDHATLTRRLQEIARAHPEVVRLERAGLSLGGREVWRVELGSGPAEQRGKRPALLVVAGIEGTDLVGSVSALAWVEHLAANAAAQPPVRTLLEQATLYVFPRLNPDAAEAYFATPRHEEAGNGRPVDDDRDGLVDEDGPEDLNGDGRITSMRVEDPAGESILDPTDARLLVRADPARGEAGAWRLLTEGVDSDQDEAWNEDPPGGVNLNRNFPFNYRFFAPDAGAFPLSEPVTRMLGDFVIAHPNIAVAFTFGPSDNLLKPPKAEGDKQPLTAVSEADLPWFRELGKTWRESLGVKKELEAPALPGTFADWMYFHRGRLSLAALPWSPALAVARTMDKPSGEANNANNAKRDGPAENGAAANSAKRPENQAPDTKPAETQPPEAKTSETKPGEPQPKAPDTKPAETKSADKKPGDAKPDAKPSEEKRNQEEREFLKWLDAHAPEQFVPWKPVTHRDFPGKRVEVGGLAPFARNNPPEPFLEDLAEQQGRFLTALAGKLPRIGFRRAEARHVGNSVYEVTVQVENTGYLPTSLAHGQTTREVHPTRVTLQLDAEAFLAGTRVAMLGPLSGSGGMREVRWTVRAKDRPALTVEAVSMLGGTVRAEIPLKKD